MSNETLGMIQLGLLSLAIFIGFPTAFTLLALGLSSAMWVSVAWSSI